MTPPVFTAFDPSRRDACLALFDANCPAFFAPNERADYAVFLADAGAAYALCLMDGRVAGAFGVTLCGVAGRAALNWIMVDPTAQGRGIGSAIMAEAAARAAAMGAAFVDIAASQFSAPFFERFGAHALSFTAEGWGPEMHRIDMEWPLARQA